MKRLIRSSDEPKKHLYTAECILKNGSLSAISAYATDEDKAKAKIASNPDVREVISVDRNYDYDPE